MLGASILLPLPGANGQIAHIPAICPFYIVTGLPCPGCGLTRAFVCLGHGRFSESLHWHPIGWLVYGAFIWLWAYYGLYAITRKRPYIVAPRWKKYIGYTSAAILLGTGFTRIAWILVTHHHPF